MHWWMALLSRSKNANLLQVTRKRGILISLFALAAGATAIRLSRRRPRRNGLLGFLR